MESLLVTGIGLAAVGYFAYLARQKLTGKAKCDCGCANSCPAGGCHSKADDRERKS